MSEHVFIILDIVSWIKILYPSYSEIQRQEYCQAQVQSPKSQSQDPKNLGWHYNHKTSIDSGSCSIDSSSYP